MNLIKNISYTSLFILQWGNKSIETRINFGFNNLDNAIGFYDLINIDGIGIKTALKIIKNGYQELLSLVQENNSYEINQKYGLSNYQSHH